MPRADSDVVSGPDTLQLPPDAKAVVLPRDKFQELMDELTRLREQAKPGKPMVPSFCDVAGQADGDLARLHISFKFRTERDNQRVALGPTPSWTDNCPTLARPPTTGSSSRSIKPASIRFNSNWNSLSWPKKTSARSPSTCPALP
jgi:hypothetical protein